MKIFGIGLSKTGTTSLNRALNILKVSSAHDLHGGNYSINEYILDLINNNFDHYIWSSFDGFTDIPIPLYYKDLDRKFPNSKFILTVRSKSSWVGSCDKHFANMRSTAKMSNEFKKAINIPCDSFIRTLVYGMSKYDKERYLDIYLRHNRDVIRYFKNRPNDLLIMNICGGDGWKKLCKFLKKPIPKVPFPCENRGN